MVDDRALKELIVEFVGWDTQKLVLAIKNIEGRLFLDVRKWYFYNNATPRPTKKGMMLEFKDWRIVIEHIKSLISEEYKQAA